MNGQDKILLASLQRAFNVPADQVHAAIAGTCDAYASYLGRFVDGLSTRLLEQVQDARGINLEAVRPRMDEVLSVLTETQGAFASLGVRASRRVDADQTSVQKEFLRVMQLEAPTLKTLFSVLNAIGAEKGVPMNKIRKAGELLDEICTPLGIATTCLEQTGASAQLAGQLRPLVLAL